MKNLHAWTQTFTGKKFCFFNPDPESICIEDIAHALSHLCRYTGHVKFFYSVAQHSVLMSQHCSERSQMACLLHDASEAYCADVPRPLKRCLPVYQNIEDDIMMIVANKYGFEWPMSDEVKDLDTRMLVTEKAFLFDHHLPWPIDDLEPVRGVQIEPWSSERAKQEFLRRYDELRS